MELLTQENHVNAYRLWGIASILYYYSYIVTSSGLGGEIVCD